MTISLVVLRRLELLDEERAESMRAFIQRHPLIARLWSVSPLPTKRYVGRMVRQLAGLRIARAE